MSRWDECDDAGCPGEGRVYLWVGGEFVVDGGEWVFYELVAFGEELGGWFELWVAIL